MKKLFMFMMALMISLTSFAQTATQDYSLLENTYVGIYGGAFTPMNFNSVMPINGNAGLKIGKQLNTVVGVNVEGDAFFGSNNYSFSQTVVRGLNAGVNLNLDLFNIFSNYKPYRKFTVITETGIGYGHLFRNDASDTDILTTKTGLIANWRVSKPLSLFIEPSIIWGVYDLTNAVNSYPRFSRHDAQLGIQAGIVYHFKNHDGTRTFTKYNISSLNDEINSLRGALAKKPKEVVKEVVREISRVDTVYNVKAVIFFAKSDDTLNDVSELEKIPTGTTVQVHGYASPEGSAEVNKELSQKRANNVANFLKSRNVKVTQVIGHGADKNTSNRVVLVY